MSWNGMRASMKIHLWDSNDRSNIDPYMSSQWIYILEVEQPKAKLDKVWQRSLTCSSKKDGPCKDRSNRRGYRKQGLTYDEGRYNTSRLVKDSQCLEVLWMEGKKDEGFWMLWEKGEEKEGRRGSYRKCKQINVRLLLPLSGCLKRRLSCRVEGSSISEFLWNSEAQNAGPYCCRRLPNAG